MQKSIHSMTLAALAAILLLTACGPSEAELKATAAAQTLEVISIKETAMIDTLQKLTQTEAAKPPTETPIPTRVTETPAATATLSGLATPTNPPATGNEQAELVSETIPDGTIISAGATFTKTWKLVNQGTSTWSTGYALVFVSGDQMNAKSEVYLQVPVAPGTVVDISVPMTAPAVNGTYRGDWKLRNASGQIFGRGAGGLGPIWVEIVVGPPLPTSTATITPTSNTTSTATITMTPIP